MRISKSGLARLAAALGAAGVLAGAIAACGDRAANGGTAAGAVVLEVYLDPGVADALDRGRLERRIERTAMSALGGQLGIDVTFVDTAFEPRLQTAAEELAAELRLPALHAAYLESAGSDAAAMTAARDAFRAAEAELRRQASAQPLVALPPGHLGVEVHGARQHGAARVGAERWVRVQTGVARREHGRGETFEQSVANSVVQGLGLVAGLTVRDSEPADAMATRLDVAAGELRTRDQRAVRFNITDQQQVIRALVALSKES